ncbi:helix-turn-helix domain-containing protein [Paenibacillaceae bacterium WGS1546]|uniref:response regulator transcription factor n=1 Tax=Cohnella sp. WGS1546 TaxID=3366810 RepID=UPI00372D6B0E
MNVLIVDDEIYAVKGLLSGVRWKEIGVDEVYEAYHAPMARQVLLERDIDIVICDIEMPETNGLELMEWVKAQGMRPETIVLTCHSEFAYAQKAIHLGSFQYLLKPVAYAELESVLKEAIARVAERKRRSEADEQYGRIVELWNSRKPVLIERFWQDLLERRISSNPGSVAEALSVYEVNMASLRQVRLILISVEEWMKPLNERDELIMEFALRKAAEEVLLKGMPGNVVQDQRGHLLAVLHLGEREADKREIEARCREYLEACGRYFYCKVSCYVGVTADLADVLSSYLTLLDREYRNVSTSNEVIWEDAKNDPGDGGAVPGMTEPMLDWADLLERGLTDEFGEKLEAWLSRLDTGQTTIEDLIAAYHSLLQVIYYSMHRKGIPAQQLYETGCPGADEATRSVLQFKLWARCMRSAADRLFAKPPAISPVVRKVIAHISANLTEELSREQLASIAFVNPAYLSRLFRKETGMVLTDYILQEKMRKAAELLATTDESVSEIADRLHYGNFSYFARLFRKVHGVAPHDYRKPSRKA